MKNTQFVTRWVVTVPTKGGLPGHRRLAHPCQGRHTYATKEEAEGWIKAYFAQGRMDVLGNDLKAQPCPCYPGHFDPSRIWFKENEQ